MNRPISPWLAGGLLLLLTGAPEAGAAVPVALRTYATMVWTDNLFQSRSERGERIQQLAFDMDIGRPGLAGYYTGQVDVYEDYGDLLTHTHTVGLAVSRNGANRQRLTADLQASLRSSRAAFDYRDYLQSRATLTARRYLGPTTVLRGSGGLALRDYRHAGDFSYAEPTGWVQLSHFLSSGTTLVAGTQAGVKAYLRDGTADSTSIWARSAGTDAQILASVWFKVAQSLAPRTGLQLRYARQSLWTGRPRYRRPEDYAPVDELFDDAYGYGGDAWRMTLKHVGRRFEALVIGERSDRHYDDRPALDLDGVPVGPTRQDQRTGLRLRLSRDLAAPTPATDASVHMEASTLVVSSNDSFYDTTVRLLSVSLEVGF